MHVLRLGRKLRGCEMRVYLFLIGMVYGYAFCLYLNDRPVTGAAYSLADRIDLQNLIVETTKP